MYVLSQLGAVTLLLIALELEGLQREDGFGV